MKLFSRTKFNKLKYFLKKIPRILAENSFLTIIVLFFLSLILGGFIYYKYFILVKAIEPQIIKTPLQLEEKTFQKILNEWIEREKRFQETNLKEYPNLFKESSPEELTR